MSFPYKLKHNSNKQVKADDQLVHLAVYDFDGTSILGNSPVLLVRYLVQQKMLAKRVVFKIMLWAIAYKLRLPQNETWVRGLVFTAFQGKPQAEVDQFLSDFYDVKIDCRFRKEAEKSMLAHREQGDVIIVVSASFEPIVRRAMEKHPFQYQVSTKMRVDAKGNYTCSVDGTPIEGKEKVNAVCRLADELFGAGAWEITYAYGDHHSDEPLLSAAKQAFAVSPDNPLERVAKREGWPIVMWGQR